MLLKYPLPSENTEKQLLENQKNCWLFYIRKKIIKK